MAADVSIFAALFAGADQLSCRPACCRWCRPTSSIWPATSLERLADADRRRGAARHAACGAVVRGRILDGVRGAGRRRQRDRRGVALLFARARRSWPASPSSSWACTSSASRRSRSCIGRRASMPKAGRLVGRLCDGACLRVWLDAVHRPDPGGDPRGRGLAGDRDEGRRPARRLFARARHAVHDRGAGGRAVRGLPRALSRPSRAWWRR